MAAETLIILLVEDDEGHAQLVQRNLTRAGITNSIIHVRDGQQALDYVRCAGAYAGRVPNGPLLLLLDINMPRGRRRSPAPDEERSAHRTDSRRHADHDRRPPRNRALLPARLQH